MQCATMATLSSANTKYTAEQLVKATGISSETLATWGLTEATDSLTMSQLAEMASSDAQAKKVLEKIVAQNAQAVANGKVTASNTTLAASEASATLATGSLTTAIKANIAAMWTWMTTTPLGWLTLLAAGIFAAVKAYDALTVSAEEANEKIDESRSAYQETTSTIESMNSELEITKQKIEELEAKDALSFTDKEELDNLREQNNELERSIALHEKKQKNEATQTVADIKQNEDTLNDDFEKSIKNLSEYKKEYEETKQIGLKGMSEGTVTLENYEVTMAAMDKEMSRYEATVLDNIEKYEQYKEDIINKYGTDDISAFSQSDRSLYENIVTQLQSAYKEIYTDSEYNKFVIEPIFNEEKLKGLQDELLKYFISGGQTDLSSLEEKFGSDIITALRNACIRAGIDFDKMIGDIYNNSQSKLNQIAPMVAVPTSAYDAKQNSISEQIRDYIQNDLSDEDRTILLNAEIPDNVKLTTKQDVDDFVASLKTEVSDKTSIPSIIDSWNSLIDTDVEELKNTRKDLLALAEAGQLTAETFHDTAGADTFLDSISESLPEAIEWINQLVSSSTQLQSMSTQISKMSDMLADKKNGTVASASDLAGFDAKVRGLDSWKEFENVMGSTTSTMEECQAAANALATEWVNDGNFLSNLTDENKAYYETQLDQMGVANAQEIVENALAIARENEATQTEYATIATQHNSEAKSENEMVSTDLTNATASEIAQLLTEANVSEATKGKIVELWLAKVDLNSTKINTASDVEQIVAIANAAGASVGYVNALKKALNDLVDAQTTSHKPSDLSIDGFNTINDWKNESNKSDFEKFVDNMEKQKKQDKVDDLLSKLKQNIKGTQLKASDFQIKPTGSQPYKDKNKSKGKGSSSKKSKTEIDWIERKITILNNKIDEFATKTSDAWSSWTSRSKALNSEMETTKKLLTSVYGVSDKLQKKYNKQKSTAKIKLDNYVKDNSKVLTSSTIKKINNGTLDTSKLSKKDKKVVEKYKKLQKDYEKKAKKASQNPAADYYFSKANSVAKKYKLSPAIIKKIKNGTINISDYNESMANAIQKYQDYYDKGKDAQKSKKETKQKLNELAQQNFELIQSKWDSRIGYQENRKNAVSDALNLAQSKGQLIGSAYYTKQKGINDKEISQYKKEEAELKKAMKGVKKYSEEWYNMKSKISEVHSKYVQLQADNAELQNSINELKFDRFDELINKFDDIIDESDFLIGLLDSDNLFNSDNGSITNDGITAMGLTAQNYDVYLAQAEEYKKSIADLEQMYKNGEIGLTQYNSQMREYQQGMRNSIKSANDAKKAVID